MEKLAISDSSILIHLARIKRFYILRDLFGIITIPEEVFLEIVERGWGLNG